MWKNFIIKIKIKIKINFKEKIKEEKNKRISTKVLDFDQWDKNKLQTNKKNDWLL